MQKHYNYYFYTLLLKVMTEVRYTFVFKAKNIRIQHRVG